MIRLAMEYRAEFHTDVVLDIVCYRRHGHNEGDEPSYTQPLLYAAIEAHPTVRTIYQDYLVRKQVLTRDAATYDDKVQARLKESLDSVRASEPPPVLGAPAGGAVAAAGRAPDGGAAHRLERTTARLAGGVYAASEGEGCARSSRRHARRQPIDFATCEALAFASLVCDGVPVRLVGQVLVAARSASVTRRSTTLRTRAVTCR